LLASDGCFSRISMCWRRRASRARGRLDACWRAGDPCVVSVQKRSHPLIDEGYSLLVRDERELDTLDDCVRAQIPDDVVALLADPARRLHQHATSASHPCVTRLVDGLAERRVHVEIHVGDPTDAWSATDVIARFPRSREDEWAIGLRGAARVDCLPPSSPTALLGFYEHFGGLDLRYGWSPVLFGPSSVRLVADALADRGASLDATASRPLEGAYAFYEVDGDLLCWLADGDAAWLGGEWVDGGEVRRCGDVGNILTELFEHALRGERYHG